VALALGGNLGGPGEIEATLRLALEQLRESLGKLRVASLYRGAAVSALPQPDYFNTAAVGHTTLAPEAVLAIAKALELAAGRRAGPRFGPRPLDIDLLLYGSLRQAAPELTLPHPRLAHRRFVLAPLAEIAPELAIPPLGALPGELLQRLPASAPPVQRLDWSGPADFTDPSGLDEPARQRPAGGRTARSERPAAAD
jgi:2-amino-4-hydroxy-6-hydroxymethyldihydropteridine diphosphokinase